jgi:DsbC/DsbD-like thiol-disulfide interchange protein
LTDKGLAAMTAAIAHSRGWVDYDDEPVDPQPGPRYPLYNLEQSHSDREAAGLRRSGVSRTALCLIVGGLLAAGMAHAQAVRPAGKVTEVSTDHLKIRYTHEVVETRGGAVSFVVQIEPRRSMHVYAPGADDYQVISLGIDEHARVRTRPLRYPASEIYFFQPLNEKIPVYEKPFTLSLDAIVEKTAGPLSVTGRLDYQACDDRVCFAPVSVPLSWSVRPNSSVKQISR